MAEPNEWLKLAPPPAALPAGRRWHVFLSYRSVERPWVLALYDALTQLGYQTFLDQFVLDASSNLSRSLEENLEASQAGILIWSPRNEDSNWCKREYDSFVTLEDTGSFHFTIARLGGAELPLFARNKLWVDFSDDREGPRGTSLLRILYGLQGKPLPDQAVRMAAQIDEETRTGLARIRSLANNEDPDAIVQLSRSDPVAWRASPLLRCACAQSLISIGARDKALGVLDDVIREFPKSLRPRQLRGLALARLGKWREAKEALGELYELGERDPETVGIYARTWMDSFADTGNELHLRRSRDLYAEAFKGAPSNYYVGINAASKSIFLRELEKGTEYARSVEAVVGNEVKAGDYWMTATIAEVQLIQRRFEGAGRIYGDAVAMAPTHVDDHRSTWKQAKRLLEYLGATPAESTLVSRSFAHLKEDSDAAVT